jgi:hypothetical protein
MQLKRVTILCRCFAVCAFWISSLPMLQSAAPAQTTQESQAAQTGAKKAKPSAPARNASESEIKAAKDSGKVWVNTASGVYHKSGKWYGATKQGKFMTEQDAVKAGYRAAKNEK